MNLLNLLRHRGSGSNLPNGFIKKTFGFGFWPKMFVIFAGIGVVIRLFLIASYRQELDLSVSELAKIFLIGGVFDFLTLCYFAIFPLLCYLLLPEKVYDSRKFQIFLKIIYFLFLSVIVFSSFSEMVFFDEFQARFNFIAVDYLIYTQEVINNIVESYPIIWLLLAILLIAGAIFFFSTDLVVRRRSEMLRRRALIFAAVLAVLVGEFFLVDSAKLNRIFANRYHQELAYNGIYQLFSAFWRNQINFDQFYSRIELKDAAANVRRLISSQENKAKFIANLSNKNGEAKSLKNPISRQILASKPDGSKPYNIIFVAIESLSADFMSSFGNKNSITPRLDELAKKGLFFTNLKATGTRTVRGLEALVLSAPPTPGNSIVRRPNNENLFNISSPLRDLGYKAKFIYGGDGYFDNMNYFFSHNGFDVVDRRNFSRDEISFSNAWGVADEDLFKKVIKEADATYAKNQPFFNFVLTTSNHRPFTYPEGKIDIPSKSNRSGAVKYSDYAIGKLVEMAKTKPWFDKTIFVFIADHCAGSAGNTDLPLWRYQIPAIFYAPKIIKPAIYSKNASQIDIAPTLLGLLNIGYKSNFFGVDLLNNSNKASQRAFVSTYSDLGYFVNNRLYVLSLKKQNRAYQVRLEKFGWNGSKETKISKFPSQEMIDAISYYQLASYLFKNGEMADFEK